MWYSVQGGLKLDEISSLNSIHVFCEFNYANKSRSAVRSARRKLGILARRRRLISRRWRGAERVISCATCTPYLLHFRSHLRADQAAIGIF